MSFGHAAFSYVGWKETALAGAEGVAGRTEAGTDEAVDAGNGVGA